MSHSPRHARVAIHTAKNIPQASIKKGSALTEELCLRVLGYLDELRLGSYQIPDTSEAIRQFLFEKENRGGVGNKKTQKHLGEKIDVLTKIDTILGDTTNGVADVFKTILADEGQKYARAFDQLRTIGGAEWEAREIFKKIIAVHEKSKQENKGKLTQTVKDAIGKLEHERKNLLKLAEEQRKGTSEEVQGFLHAQRLLQYKQQKQSGFVIPPSRQALIDGIMLEISMGNKVFLASSTGTGKTELAIYVADAISGTHELIPWHEGTRQRDILGRETIATDEHGNISSQITPGPLENAMKGGHIMIHEEITAGTVNALMSYKYLGNVRAGQTTQINGREVIVKPGYGELSTGNLADAKTKDRTQMDPAILRLWTGIDVAYMTPDEVRDIILSDIITDAGILPLSRSEMDLITTLTQVSQMMQLFHERKFDDISKDFKDHSSFAILKAGCTGGDLSAARLDTIFLDPGTLMGWFRGLGLTIARGGDLRSHIADRIAGFLDDGRNANMPHEKKLIRAIFQFSGLIDHEQHVMMPPKKDNESSYQLPSQLNAVFTEKPKEEVEIDTADSGGGGEKGEERGKKPGEYPPEGPHWDYNAVFAEAQSACDTSVEKATIKWLDLDSDPRYQGPDNAAWKAKILAAFPDARNHNNCIPVWEYAPGKRLPLITAFAPTQGTIITEEKLSNGQPNPAYTIQNYATNHIHTDHGKNQTYGTYDFWGDLFGADNLPTKQDFEALARRYPYPKFAKILGMKCDTNTAKRNAGWYSPKNAHQNTANSFVLSSSLHLDGDVYVLCSNASYGGVDGGNRHDGNPSLLHL